MGHQKYKVCGILGGEVLKREEGIISIEATLALTFFTFLILFMFSFGTLYRAQSIVSHGTVQASQSLALESRSRNSVGRLGLDGLALELTEIVGVDIYGMLPETKEPISSANLVELVRQNFARSIATDEDEADALLRSVGVIGGLLGIDFSDSYLIEGDNTIVIHARYRVRLTFDFFGAGEIEMTRTAKSRMFYRGTLN